MFSKYLEIAKIKERNLVKSQMSVNLNATSEGDRPNCVLLKNALITKPTHNSSLKESSKLTTFVLQ